MITTLLIVFLILFVIDVYPSWQARATGGMYRSGGLLAVLVILLILYLLGNR